jgi:hypothetical protein
MACARVGKEAAELKMSAQMMSKTELTAKIIQLLRDSELEYSEQLAAWQAARPMQSTETANEALSRWRASRKPLLKEKEKKGKNAKSAG